MNLLSKILQNKKIVIPFLLLFFIILGIFIPHIAYGSWGDTHWWEYMIPGWNTYKIGANTANSVVGKGVEVAVTATLTAFILAVAILLVAVFGTLSNLAGGLLLYIIGLASNPVTSAWSYTHFTNTIIATGWPEVRDLANMVVVLGFVVIGIATALRIREYEAKKLLPKLIIAAILINFSLLICGVFIDGSNIVISAFLKSGGFLERSVADTLAKQIDSLWQTSSFTDSAQIAPLMGITMSLVFFDIITLVIFFAFFFLFLFRYIALWILVILSPLAFVFSVFPFTKKFFSMWWSNFLQWCIIGIPAAFFLYLADKLTSGLVNASGAANAANAPNMMTYIVPSVFLIAGFLFSLQTSAMGASIAIGAAKWTGGKAGGVSKFAANASGLSRVGANVKDRATSMGEKLGVVSKGTTVQNQAKRLEGSKKRLSSIQDNSQLAKIAEQRAITHEQAQDKAAAAAILAERKAFGAVDVRKRDAVAAHANAFGVPKDTFTKVRPETFTGTPDKGIVQRVKSGIAGKGFEKTPDEVLERARYTKAKAVEKDKGISFERAWDENKEYNPTTDEVRDARAELEKKKITQNALGIAPVSEKDARNKYVEKAEKHFVDAGFTRAEAREKAAGDKPQEHQIAEIKQTLVDENIDKGFAKLDVGAIRSLPNEALGNLSFGKNVGTQRLERAMLEMSQDKIKAMKENLVPAMQKEGASKLGLPDGWDKGKTKPQRHKELKNAFDSMHGLTAGWDTGLSKDDKETARKKAFDSLAKDKQKEITEIQDLIEKVNKIKAA